ncbi:MAG: type II secretion system secretin GspD [Pseudomonadota bacterium]
MKSLVRSSSLFFAAALLFSQAWAQQTMTTPNFKDANIREIVEAVAEITGKSFIIDPRVNASNVTILSSTPMEPEAFYEAFLSILEVHQLAAITSGDVIKIIPNATARQGVQPIGVGGARGGDDIITQVIPVNNVGASQLVPILRPLVPQFGHLVAHAGSNMLIISDRAANVNRIVTIVKRIDMSSESDIEVVPLQHASAAEIVRVLTSLTATPRADGAPVSITLVADARTNSVLIGGDKAERLRVRTLVAHLDTPLEDGGESQVRYLRYADAESLATQLQTQFTQAATTGAAGTPGASPISSDQISVWADQQTNALVINAPPKTMRSMMQIIDKLDIRRAQVLVEAIIVEVRADQEAQLGITWAVEGSGSNTPIGVTNFPGSGANIIDLAAAASAGDNAANAASAIGSGVTLGVGRISDSGVSFAAVLNALEGSGDTNIISTPSIVTTDNEEASINVGQEVPFVTGSFTNAGQGVGGAVNPFQTIQREQVGVKLSITPQINEGDSMLLQISQEISSVSQSASSAVDLITNERIVETTVIVDDGQILVLGGLLEDTLIESNQAVPLLGRLPLLGNLFRSRRTETVKTNLMIFIRPKILRDSVSTAIETNQKYDLIRQIQQGTTNEPPALIPGAERPVLPPMDDEETPPQP